MKTIKLAVIAAAIGAVGLSAAPSAAQPHRPGWHGHRHRVCTTRWYHHHKVRRCYWR